MRILSRTIQEVKMKRVQLFLLSLVCLANIAWMWHSNPKADDCMQNGYKAWQAGNLTEALSFYEEALKYEPKRADAMNFLGVIYEELGLSDKAEEKYLSSIKVDDTLLSAYFNLGVLYWNRGEIQKSIYYFQKRVEMGSPRDEWTIKAQQALNNIHAKEDIGRRTEIAKSMDIAKNTHGEASKMAHHDEPMQQTGSVDGSRSDRVIIKEYSGPPSSYPMKTVKATSPVRVKKAPEPYKKPVKAYQPKKDASSEALEEPQGYQKGLIPWMCQGIKNMFQ